jgi:hypothetical protein
MRYAFNHDAEKLSDTFGISEERFGEFVTLSREIFAKVVMGDKNMTNHGHAIEHILNTAQPKDHVETAVAVLVYMMFMKEVESRFNPVAGLLAALRGRGNE